MSTRCVINFCFGKQVKAKIYRHCDGYPDGVLPDLTEFFNEVKRQTYDTRFHDPSYLAAKFVVWQAELNAATRASYYPPKCEKNNLDFLGVGIIMNNPGDIEYEYFIRCYSDGVPIVEWRPYGSIALNMGLINVV